MEVASVPENERLSKFRQILKTHQLDGYIIPHNDAHDSEYIASCDERICFISGFSGSNGLGFVTQNDAILWTDSRYYLQAEKELFPGWVMRKMERGEAPWFAFVSKLLVEHPDAKIGFDPKLISAETCETRMGFFEKNHIKMTPVDSNLVDQLWINKPALPKNPIFIHEVEYCGEPSSTKLQKLKEKLLESNENKANFSFLTSKLDEIAYLLNLRGSDIDYNPVFLSYLFLEFGDSITGHIFTNKDRLEPPVHQYLSNLQIQLNDYNDIWSFLKNHKGTVYVEKVSCNYSLIHSISNKDLIVNKLSPISLMKAVKNARELKGLRDCHVRDGAAVVAYLAWLKNELLVKKNNGLTEFTACLKLEEYRKIQKFNKGLSFDTISAIGPNGAIVHYKPEEKTASVMKADQVYLLDSGGQYLDGTTDITRTVHYTQAKPEEKNAYTRVLLGNLDLERVQWPQKSKIHGGDLDVLARRRLWEAGLDYGHGTGHGVGYFLNVHEGPHGISKHRDEPLLEGMIVTDEPGYYESGKFGIRIENCLLVVKKQEGFLGFDNITMTPYDRNLIDLELLSKWDRDYIDRYHQLVLEKVSPVLKEMAVEEYVWEWLNEATKPL